MYNDITLIVETKKIFIIQTKEKASLIEEPYLIDKLSFSETDYNSLNEIVGFTTKFFNKVPNIKKK